MFMIVFSSLLLVMIIYLIFYIVFYKSNMDYESMSAYECGFDLNSYTRMSFSYRFFLISILFIIFDVEISLMLPIPFLKESVMGLWMFCVFVLILIGGLIYEYFFGSLNWLS